jgi:small subunit ribosomal protein S4
VRSRWAARRRRWRWCWKRKGLAERDIPDYVVPDGTAKVTFSRVPTLDEVPYPVKMEPNLVVEFYSR